MTGGRSFSSGKAAGAAGGAAIGAAGFGVGGFEDEQPASTSSGASNGHRVRKKKILGTPAMRPRDLATRCNAVEPFPVLPLHASRTNVTYYVTFAVGGKSVRPRLTQIAAFAAGLQPHKQEQRAFGVRQVAPDTEEFMHPLTRKAEHAGKPGLFSAAGKLALHRSGKFVPEWSVGAGFQGGTAPWSVTHAGGLQRNPHG
jgi:hypothetical protein